MNTAKQFSTATYDPHKFLNSIAAQLGAKNDAQLSRALGFEPPVISKIRHRKLGVSAELAVRIGDVTGKTINELREMMGMPKVTPATAAQA